MCRRPVARPHGGAASARRAPSATGSRRIRAAPCAAGRCRAAPAEAEHFLRTRSGRDRGQQVDDVLANQRRFGPLQPVRCQPAIPDRVIALVSTVGHHRENLASLAGVQAPKTGEVRDVDFDFLDGEIGQVSLLHSRRLRGHMRRVGEGRRRGRRQAGGSSQELPPGLLLIKHRCSSLLHSGNANASTFDPEAIATYWRPPAM